MKAKLTEKAHEAGLSLSQYLIKSGLGKRIQSKGNYNALAALVKITALQNICLTKVPEFIARSIQRF
uniref:plasmid mobilization protein n=1 Tax=Klebsiella pneumoniae TaxID=573 RepID=UPI0022BA5CD2|nr:hypothetical protein [Klebsiella pneumoniae]